MEVLEFVRELDGDRKPSRWEEVESVVRIEYLEKYIRAGQIKEYDIIEIYESGSGESCFESFNREMEYVFIVKIAGERYLVNTEGYDYARYVVKVKGKEEDKLEKEIRRYVEGLDLPAYASKTGYYSVMEYKVDLMKLMKEVIEADGDIDRVGKVLNEYINMRMGSFMKRIDG